MIADIQKPLSHLHEESSIPPSTATAVLDSIKNEEKTYFHATKLKETSQKRNSSLTTLESTTISSLSGLGKSLPVMNLSYTRNADNSASSNSKNGIKDMEQNSSSRIPESKHKRKKIENGNHHDLHNHCKDTVDSSTNTLEHVHCCPICSIPLNKDIFEQHFRLELLRMGDPQQFLRESIPRKIKWQPSSENLEECREETEGSGKSEENMKGHLTRLRTQISRMKHEVSSDDSRELHEKTRNKHEAAPFKRSGTKQKACEISRGSVQFARIRERRKARAGALLQSRTLQTGTFEGLAPPDLQGMSRSNELADRLDTNIIDRLSSSVQRCFLCEEELFGDLEDINQHIDRCLAKYNHRHSDGPNSEGHQSSSRERHYPDSPPTTRNNRDMKSLRRREPKVASHHGGPLQVPHNGVFFSPMDGPPQVESYSWCGQRRVRLCSLLESDYATTIDGERSRKELVLPEDDELDIVDNDSQCGPAQYSESDLILPHEEINSKIEIDEDDDCGKLPIASSQSEWLIESLKAQIREQRTQTENKYQCLICLEEYKVPLVSINCWHVHCESCWMESLGTKRLCPQCKVITSPADLRRIYL